MKMQLYNPGFYGVDWLITLFVCIQFELFARKKRCGFIVAAISGSLGVLLGFLASSFGIIIGNVIILLYTIRGYYRFEQNEGNAP